MDRYKRYTKTQPIQKRQPKEGKLDFAEFVGQHWANNPIVPVIIQVRYSSSNESSPNVNGEINGIRCRFFIDTGATQGIIQSGLIKSGMYTGKRFVIITATGEKVMAVGEMQAEFTLGKSTCFQNVLVADILEECIIRMDFLVNHKATLDICKQILGLEKHKIQREITPNTIRSFQVETQIQANNTEINITQDIKSKLDSTLLMLDNQQVERFLKDYKHMLICQVGRNGLTHEVKNKY